MFSDFDISSLKTIDIFDAFCFEDFFFFFNSRSKDINHFECSFCSFYLLCFDCFDLSFESVFFCSSSIRHTNGLSIKSLDDLLLLTIFLWFELVIGVLTINKYFLWFKLIIGDFTTNCFFYDLNLSLVFLP